MTARERRLARAGMPALDLIEEAVNLLRRTPPGAYLALLTGAVPFWLALLFFVSDMTQNAYAPRHISEAALGVGVLFIWMKCWQTVFAARLRGTLANRPPPPWTASRIARLVAAQALWQPVGLVLRLMAAPVLLPYVWIASFFQHVTVLGDGAEEDGKSAAARAWTQARLWPGQTYVASLAVLIFALFVWINVMLALAMAPAALKIFLGIETDFSRSFESMLNSTFLTMAIALTAMALDPVWKAIFVVRCFQGASLRTGEDLLVDLRHAGAPLRTAAVAMLALAVSFGGLRAENAAPAPSPAAVRKLDERISDVLERREYAWRAPREKMAGSEEGILSAWVKGGLGMVTRAWRTVWKVAEAAWDAIFGRTGGGGKSFSLAWMPAVAIAVAILVLAAAAFWIVRKLYLHRRKLVFATVQAAPMPDLHSEDVVASQLPGDEWLALARQHADAGQWTVALRAAWLACLAHLGERELLGIARHKSNRDYDRELRRRARTREDLLAAFGQNLSAFERAWYGRHDVDAADYSAFEENLERIRAC